MRATASARHVDKAAWTGRPLKCAPGRVGLLAAIGLGLVASLVAVTLLALGAAGSSLFDGARSGGVGTGAPGGLAKDGVGRAYAKLPLAFEPNRGQTDSRVRFLARGAGYSLFLTPGEAVLSLRKEDPSAGAPAPGSPPSRADNTAVVRMQLLGANAHPQLAAAAKLPGHSNYLVGRDQSKWRSGVPHYARVRYKEVYPGTDVVYYGDQGRVEYDFELAAGADPRAIALRFTGTKRPRVDPRGDLLLATAAGTVRQHKPVAYQQVDGRRHAVQSRYVLKGDRGVGLSLGAYDTTKPLVIDPVLDYSTYLGGTGYDEGRAIAVDASGSAYVTGVTGSTDFPTKSPLDPTPKHVFVTKFNPAGSALVYSTYLGGTYIDRSAGIAVDGSGSAYVVGDTGSTDFPTTQNAFDRTGPVRGAGSLGNGRDAFVAKLNPAGSGLDYSTYLGGDAGGITYGSDAAGDVAVDAGGRAYVVGGTESVDFPTKNAFDPVVGGIADMFVAKLDPARSGADSLVYSTYLGGSGGAEGAGGIAVDASGSAYVTGSSSADDFPTKNAFQALRAPGPCPPFGCHDAVVTKLKPAGNELDYSTYLGGTGLDAGRDVAVEPSGAAYVTGDTWSADDPAATPPERGYPTTPGAFQRQNGGFGDDAFVTKLTAAGSALAYSTYLGGSQLPGDDSSSGYDHGNGIAADSCGSAYVTGQTTARNFPTKDAVQPAYGGDDAPSPGPVFPADDVFITKLNTAGSGLEYSTYLGGKGQELQENSQGIAVNPSTGTAYVTGHTTLYTGSNDFPTTSNAFQPAFAAPPPGSGASSDAFVASLSAPFTPCAAPPATPAISINDVAVGEGDSGDVNATFTVSLSASPTQPVSVRYATADGTATAPDDYAPADGTVDFGVGETNKAVTVAVQGDRVDEPDERFFVNLSGPQNATVAVAQAVGTIVDDDGAGGAPGGGPAGGPGGPGGAAGGGGVVAGGGPPPLKSGRCANEQRGTEGPETLNGTPEGDNLVGLGGDDLLVGLQAEDCLFGGLGADRLDGSEGPDYLQGDSGIDVLTGGDGDDRMWGGAGNDRLSGGKGADRLFGGAGDDRISGAQGAARGKGGNTYSGGAGNDNITAANGRREKVNCGRGRRDKVRADRTDRLRGCEIVLRLRK